MEQLVSAARAMVLGRDVRADVREVPGLAVRWADSPFPYWTCLFLTGLRDTAARLEGRPG